jgi:hypothetical protein
MHSNSDQEIRISDDSESSTTTNEQSLNLEHEIVVKPKKKKIKSLTSKRLCTFNKEWLKDPIYENFLRQCQTSKYFVFTIYIVFSLIFYFDLFIKIFFDIK